ncbi:MAG TPA: arylesterase [Cyclobacteriaceae bacterium]|jgi:acyl-CoA thioesterase-1|nr:arylesterase [Cytophagales bacterium]HMR57305.1 arylesterase [Cyclobacteriaceae bacterium]HNT51403.1 arylesterase [Cyclobacteriaceae bacterium]HRE67925.1 arylesterase [Cyclobacteriaceae bacterium]HRF34053.1 arylesterase [Cyclobacteriaceae bacterium]
MVVGKYLLLIVLLTAFSAPLPPKTILFFGDSLTAGYGLSPEEAFPALIEKELNKSEKKVKVVNAGLSGETSAGGLSRIDWILRQPVDIFVLELGANDGLRGLPLDQTLKNLQSIIDKVKAKYPQCKMVLAGMMVPPNMGKQYTDSFKNIYPDLAKKNNATLIPFLLEGVAGNEKLNQADGIHPTAEGHKIIATHLKSVFEKLI